ncbi:MAG: exodeoxyribonuclease VII small subunit [Lachnospiraceae bacterium]|nr:exodeoxyribonuclease VII small subunit [Lachnospiraceae bacterium]
MAVTIRKVLAMEKLEEKITEQKKEITLEEAFLRLDEIIGKLENRDTTLEDSFAGYQEGMELLKICNQRIDTVEKKILALNEDGETYEF